MRKRSQIQSQKIIQIRFRFIKLPVAWEVLTGALWEQFKEARLQAYRPYGASRGKELRGERQRDLGRQIPAAPLLRGRLKRIQAVDSEVLSEITDIQAMREKFF